MARLTRPHSTGGGSADTSRRPPPALEGVLSAREFGRLGALLLATAGLLGGASLALLALHSGTYEPAGGFHPLIVGLLSGAVIVGGIAIVRWPERFYPGWTAPIMALATVLITVVAYGAGAVHGPYVTMFYIWVGTSFLILPDRVAMAEVALAGVLDAVLLGLQPGHESALAEWVFTFGVIALTGWVVKRVVETFIQLARGERIARAEAQRGNDVLEEISRRESAFLTRMSHEVRNPLNSIIGFADMLGDGMVGPLNEQQAEYVGEVRNSGRHLLDLIGDVLDLARVSEGREDLVVTDVAVDAVITNAVALFRNDADRRGVHLELAPVSAGVIRGDERKVRQVLLNLLSNAVKFTPPGGTVRVAASAQIDVLTISVSDTGCGIAADDIERIFEEYRQSPAGAALGVGTGLGLPLARRFAEQHEGSLDVRSEPARGSTFTLRLPVAGPTGLPRTARESVSRAVDGLRGSRWRRPLENPRLRDRMGPLPSLLGMGGIALGGVTLLIHLLHPTHDYKPIPLIALAVGGATVLVVALSHARALTTMTMSTLIGTATLTITASNYFVGARSQPYGSMLYVWVGIAAVSFLSRRQALAHVAFVGLAYAVVLAIQPGNSVPTVGWLIVVGIVFVSSLAIDTLFSRLGALADAEREARVRLEAIRSELEDSSHHKTRFLATMSHELRTPLNAILGFSEVLGDELFGPLSDKQREYVHDLTEAGHELLSLVNDILDLAKVDAGRMDLDISEGVDVSTVLQAACAASRTVPVDVRVAEPVGPVQVDERKFRRIVGNLVDEEAAADGATRVVVAAGVTEGWLFVEVLHEGPLRARTSPQLPGGGGPPLRIGVASALAELHGGSVNPIGSGWRLSLPLRTPASRASV